MSKELDRAKNLVARRPIPPAIRELLEPLAAADPERIDSYVLEGRLGAGGYGVVYAATETLPDTLPYLLALSAGSFLYVAMSDLIPGLHKGETIGTGAIRQILLIVAGVGTILAL